MRKDAWTADDDRLLAQYVLQSIREGNTQLSAFEACGTALSKTAAACGFRWNSRVRKEYEESIINAKEVRKKLKSQNVSSTLPKSEATVNSMDSNQKVESIQETSYQNVLDTISKELEKLKLLYEQKCLENEELLKRLQEKYWADDFEAESLLKLVDHAKSLGLFKNNTPA